MERTTELLLNQVCMIQEPHVIECSIKAKLNSMLVKLSQHLPSSSLFLFHDIKPTLDSQNVIRKVEPDKLLKQIMYKIEETTNVSALQYGHMHEDNAINDYIKYKHSQGNTGLTVWKVGTYISKIRPGLGASLDRMVYDPLAHCKKGGLEIKCPYSKQGMTIEEACQDKNFCMTLKPGMPTLKIGHQYYYQVQGQMYVSCLQWVDFVVWFGAD
ncbi:unnamed protein product, partial [Pocillopora meandrina]